MDVLKDQQSISGIYIKGAKELEYCKDLFKVSLLVFHRHINHERNTAKCVESGVA